ncbi:MAG: hypothetical protein CSA07_04375 [Bacteroidia bacterium]|nr:MAG: hypothetical protein CSA07_04375 [Bacteroidia bacterium]
MDELAQKIGVEGSFALVVTPPSASTNYYTLTFTRRAKRSAASTQYVVLVNAVFPYYCGVEKDEWMNLVFCDVIAELRPFLEKDFQYLSPGVLNAKLQADDLLELAKSEVDAVRYWESKTVGQVVFNGYD